MEMNPKIIPLYLALLLATVAHMFEEVWGQFWLINVFNGLGWYLMANWIILVIPFVIFYYLIQEKPWAYYLGIVYAVLMVLNGLVHIIATLATGNYFGGFAGGLTGIALILIGIPLAYYIWREISNGEIK